MTATLRRNAAVRRTRLLRTWRTLRGMCGRQAELAASEYKAGDKCISAAFLLPLPCARSALSSSCVLGSLHSCAASLGSRLPSITGPCLTVAHGVGYAF